MLKVYLELCIYTKYQLHLVFKRGINIRKCHSANMKCCFKYLPGLKVIKLEWVHSQTQNKAQWLAACGHVSASSQSLRFICESETVHKFYNLEAWNVPSPVQSTVMEDQDSHVLIELVDTDLHHIVPESRKTKWTVSHTKIDKTKVLKTNASLMNVESIAK